MKTIAHLRPLPTGFVSIKQLASLYGISKSSIYELIRSDPSFPVINVGFRKKYMIEKDAFNKWLDARNKDRQKKFFNHFNN